MSNIIKLSPYSYYVLYNFDFIVIFFNFILPNIILYHNILLCFIISKVTLLIAYYEIKGYKAMRTNTNTYLYIVVLLLFIVIFI